MLNSKIFLGRTLTPEYEPPDLGLAAYWWHPNRPFFTMTAIDAMLTDPRVKFGLDLLRGPIIANSHFSVTTNNLALKTYVASQINRFWRNSIQTALRCMDYGFLGCEVLYRVVQNQIHFDRLKFLHPYNTRVITRKGEYIGFVVTSAKDSSETRVYRPRSFWTVHSKDQHQWYGRSRLRGSFLSWHEIWSDHGYRDQRRLWFFKNAYAGPKIGYPPGSAPPEQIGESPKPHREIAQEMLDKMVTGTGMTYPTGGEWIIEDAKPVPIPEGLLEYGDQLRDEIFEGMGIPPEVARAEGTGAFAGRRVPQQAFYSVLQEIVQDIVTDLDEQLIQPLVHYNFGSTNHYEIECFGLLRSTGSEEKDSVEQSSKEPLLQSEILLPENFPDSQVLWRFKKAG